MKKIGIVATKKQAGLVVPESYYTFFAEELKISLSYYYGIDINPEIIIIDPLNDVIDTSIDLLVLQGGPDVSPTRYGAKPSIKTGAPNNFAEYFDINVLPKYIENKTPIFGICRGLQTLNVVFGGALAQDIVQNYSSKSRGELVDKLRFTSYNKSIFLEKTGAKLTKKDGKVSCVNPKSKYEVNSLHHQGVFVNQMNTKELVPLAINASFNNPTYNNVEALMHKELPIIGVQWHPEEMVEPIYSINLIKYLLNL